MPTPQQVPTGNMMPGCQIQPLFYPNPMPINQLQQPAPYPATNYVPAPSFPPAPTAMWNQGQGQFLPYPGTMNWPQQQQQYFYPPQQNGGPWNSGS
jgi:hypothetical protein